MEALFDVGPYVVPVEEIVQAPMLAEDWLVIADQMHDERNYDAMEEALRKYEQAKRHKMIGQTALL